MRCVKGSVLAVVIPMALGVALFPGCGDNGLSTDGGLDQRADTGSDGRMDLAGTGGGASGSGGGGGLGRAIATVLRYQSVDSVL